MGQRHKPVDGSRRCDVPSANNVTFDAAYGCHKKRSTTPRLCFSSSPGNESTLSRNITGRGRRCSSSRRAHTKPPSVSAERKLLMRLDGVCRHYLAMTKSALFLFANPRAHQRRRTEARLCSPLLSGETAASLSRLLSPGRRGYERVPESKVALTVTQTSGSLLCPTDSFSRCCSDRKTAQL